MFVWFVVFVRAEEKVIYPKCFVCTCIIGREHTVAVNTGISPIYVT